MGIVLKVLSSVGLCLTVVPSFLVWYEMMPWRFHVQLMFAGMILWFVTAPFWMIKEEA